MSLITLTFGNKNFNGVSSHAVISTPGDRVKEKISKSENPFGSAIIKKTCKFFGENEVYVVAEITEGFVGKNMKATLNNQELTLVEIDSKYGNHAKKGMTIGLSFSGVKEEDLPKESILKFEKC